MKTIVHIGMPKTGSTALQSCLKQSGGYLARRGLLYPKNLPGSRSYTHHLLVAQFLAYESLPRSMKGQISYTSANIRGKLEEFLRHLRRQIATQRPEGLILSYEGLFRKLPEAKHATLRRSYRALGTEPRFVAYLRKPSEHYLSGLQQKIKWSTVVMRPRPKEYRKVLESYDACFGPSAVSARLFHRDHLENGDIVADFCKHYLAEFRIDPAKLGPGGKVNETLSAESMDILWRYRQAFHAERNDVLTRDTSQLLLALAKTDRRHDAGRPQLQPGLAETIDYASRDCLWVRDRFGVVFPDLDYDRLAAAPPAAAPGPARALALEDLVVIDREMQAQILDSVAQSSWAADDAARKAWLDAQRASSARSRGLGAASETFKRVTSPSTDGSVPA